MTSTSRCSEGNETAATVGGPLPDQLRPHCISTSDVADDGLEQAAETIDVRLGDGFVGERRPTQPRVGGRNPYGRTLGMPDRDPAEMLAHARDESRLSSTAARQIASRYTWDAAVAAIERAMGEVAPR